MSKFFGMIGYAETSETSPGIWEEVYTEKPYIGDVLKRDRSLGTNEDSTNRDIRISDRISIISDEYAWDHIFAMRYIKYMGTAWTISNVEVQRPRLLLSLGPIYHIPESETDSEKPESE